MDGWVDEWVSEMMNGTKSEKVDHESGCIYK